MTYAGSDFTTTRRRADWTITNLGILESDRVMTQAAKGTATLFFSTRKFIKMASSSYCEHSFDGAMVLAQERFRRLQFFFNTWTLQHNRECVFSERDLATYQESAEWTEFLASLPLAGATRGRDDAV